MSNFQRYTGYIYPLPQMTDEERFEYLGKVNEEATFDLDADKFMTEQLGDNKYLLWVTSSSYGKESGEFGKCRPCNQQEIYYHAPKFREILGEIDTAKLKYIDFCYYNSTECTTDYYLDSEPQKPMTLTEAIQHAKEVAASKCDECGKEHAQLAEWLQKLADYEDETLITDEWLRKNNFEFKIGDKDDPDYYLYCDDVVEITTILSNEEAGIWEICIQFLDHGDTEELNICTLGQFRMFLAICGLDNIVKQFK